MPLWSRIANTFRGNRLSREIDEELRSHMEEAIENDRDPAEARQALGSVLHHCEASRDIRLVPWLDSLRSDAVFGWRQLSKKKATSAVAILSLGLAFGACTGAFRLIDALLLRPLPVKNSDRLYVFQYEGIGFDGKPLKGEWCEYPLYQWMLPKVRDEADLLAISYVNPREVTYGSDEDMEKPYFQFVSGRMFDSFGIRPALGRLLTVNDDLKPGAHPYAVLSYDYWTRRFGRDPKVIGRTLRVVKRGEEERNSVGMPSSINDPFTIVGVAGKGFTGVEPGTITDIFVPTMMNPMVITDATWFRTFVILKPGVAVEPVREKLHAVFRAFREERGFAGMPKQMVANFLNWTALLEPVAPGISAAQREFRKPLAVLAILVALVLFVACANIANLMTSQAAARAREMALRVSIGAGRARLVQLVLMEAAILASLAAVTGGVFAWWSAPFVASHISFRNNPMRLNLPADWRVAGFGLALMLAVTILFGLAPALRASAVKPASALKGGDRPYFRGRLMRMLVAAQAAFCFLVLFASGLFVATFERLSHQPSGFSPQQLLALDVMLRRPESPEIWDQVVEHLRTVPGVAGAALGDAPLSGGFTSSGHISINGGPPSPDSAFFVGVAPGWFGVMKIPLLAGRDFRSSDASPKFAIVNEAFVKRFLPGEDPLGKWFNNGIQIIGVALNATYTDIHGPVQPVAYVPLRSVDNQGVVQPWRSETLMVRTASADPLALASTLRKEVARARLGFRVSDLHTEEELIQAQTVRERLLAVLAVFFALLALLLAGLGMYGVLDYSVLQRRREIGIRMAIGARATHIVWGVAADALAMVLAGATAGLGLGLMAVRFIEALLYQVKPGDPRMVAVPWLVLLGTALFATIPAAVRAIRTDLLATLRAD
ncbi:MAG TPA: ABC transporter permease [Bryobacteraceae bacterium]|nr:ABC transporter permease [Bryobacteraceae bacterium]